MKILNTRDVKEIIKLIESQWGAKLKLDLAFLQKKEKIYVITRDLGNIDYSLLRINNVGLYFGQVRNNEIRLSIEGSQIVGPLANKNVLKVSDQEFESWISGEDLEVNSKNHAFVLLKHNNDFVGCGKHIGNKVLNYVPKGRRVQLV